MAAADRIARDHRHDRLRHAADLHVQVGDVEAPDGPGLGLYPLSPRPRWSPPEQKRVRPLTVRITTPTLPSSRAAREGVAHLDDGLGAEGVADLRTVDRDLRDARLARALVADIGVFACPDPVLAHVRARYCTYAYTRARRAMADARPPDARPSASRSRRASDADLPRARNASSARRRTSSPSRRARASRSRCRRGLDFTIALHGMPAPRPIAVPVDLRDPGNDVTAETRIDRPLSCSATTRPGRAHDLGRDRADRAHLGNDRRREGGAASPTANLLWKRDRLGGGRSGSTRASAGSAPLPLVHVGGLSIVLRSAILRGRPRCCNERFETSAAIEALRDGAITLVSVVATRSRALLDGGLHGPLALRCALAGGGPVAPALLERARAAGIVVSQTYGLTEGLLAGWRRRPRATCGPGGRTAALLHDRHARRRWRDPWSGARPSARPRGPCSRPGDLGCDRRGRVAARDRPQGRDDHLGR